MSDFDFDLLLDRNKDIYDIIPNPNKFDDMDSDLMLINPVSEYCSPSQLNELLDQCNKRSLSFLHCNIRSLPKNLSLLNELLDTLNKPIDLIAITETKLNSKSVDNIDLINYDFFHNDSPTNAGGAGIYVNKNLKAIFRPDLKFNMPLVESCWIELDTGINKPNVMIGCIYRHPAAKLSDFTEELEGIMNGLTSYKTYILGDMNINLFNCDVHGQTEEYLNMIYSNNFFLLITKATRVTCHTATLIDHIYTNASPINITSKIITADISDHLPTFCVSDIQMNRNKEKVYFRDYKNFNTEAYLSDINSFDWNNIVLSPDMDLSKKNRKSDRCPKIYY